MAHGRKSRSGKNIFQVSGSENKGGGGRFISLKKDSLSAVPELGSEGMVQISLKEESPSEDERQFLLLKYIIIRRIFCGPLNTRDSLPLRRSQSYARH